MILPKTQLRLQASVGQATMPSNCDEEVLSISLCGRVPNHDHAELPEPEKLPVGADQVYRTSACPFGREPHPFLITPTQTERLGLAARSTICCFVLSRATGKFAIRKLLLTYPRSPNIAVLPSFQSGTTPSSLLHRDRKATFIMAVDLRNRRSDCGEGKTWRSAFVTAGPREDLRVVQLPFVLCACFKTFHTSYIIPRFVISVLLCINTSTSAT